MIITNDFWGLVSYAVFIIREITLYTTVQSENEVRKEGKWKGTYINVNGNNREGDVTNIAQLKKIKVMGRQTLR